MLVIVAYDIANRRRLARVARHCKDHGVRMQYSVFECCMEADRFERFWEELQELIVPEEDRLIAYRVCAGCAREVLTAGTHAPIDREEVAYVF